MEGLAAFVRDDTADASAGSYPHALAVKEGLGTIMGYAV